MIKAVVRVGLRCRNVLPCKAKRAMLLERNIARIRKVARV